MTSDAPSLELLPLARRFRWQYLHVVSSTASANAVLHETDIFGYGDSPYVSVCHDALGQPRHARNAAAGLIYGPFEVWHPDSRVQRHREGCQLRVEAGAVGLAGMVRSTHQTPFSFTTTLLEKGGRRSHWQVLSAGAKFHGTARYGERRQPLQGAFYMDRQWGDLPLQAVVDTWVWGHLVSRSLELIYFHILERDGSESVRLLCRRGTHWDRAGHLRSSYMDELRRRSLGNTDAELMLCFSSDERELTARLRLAPTSLLRLREDEPQAGFHASYARWRVSGSLGQDGDLAEPAFGISECLRIRPAVSRAGGLTNR